MTRIRTDAIPTSHRRDTDVPILSEVIEIVALTIWPVARNAHRARAR